MSFVDDLARVVGSAGFVPDDNNQQFKVDWLNKYNGDALAVVRPGSTEEVAAVMKLCNEAGVAVVPQGGNSGLCGGATPLGPAHPEVRDCIVMSLSRMNKIESINVNRSTATVQAGVTVQGLQEAAAAKGLLFAPDWGARGTAQIGGGISTNAGGLNVLRWGGMREQILGLEAVLPDGRIYDGLRSLRKDSTGLDLKHLFVATEGTLGVVTRAVFKLHPLPAVSQTAMLALPQLSVLMPLFRHSLNNGRGLVSAFELISEEGLGRVVANHPQAHRPLSEKTDWYVLLRLSGGAEVPAVLSELLSSAADAKLITDAAVAVTPEQESNLWFIRDEIPPPTTFDELGNRHKFDIAVPIDRVTDFIDEIAPLIDSVHPETKTYAFGHVGDGNLHFSIYPGPECDIDLFKVKGSELERTVDELTWSYGGSVSAEHGVGQTMRSRVETQKSEVELDLMLTIKKALDPKAIMNPGKVYPPPENLP